MSLEFLKPSLGLSAHLTHPCLRSVLQFGMIFVFPRPRRFAQRLALLASLNLIARNVGEERTTPPLANQLVDVGDQVNRKNDVRSAAQNLRHTSSVTYLYHWCV